MKTKKYAYLKHYKMCTTNPTHLQNLCRVCLNPEYFVSKHSDGIREHGGATLQNNIFLCPTLCKLFLSLTTLDVRQEVKDFPKHLCPICLSKLRDYEEFRDKALQSTKRLQDMINDENLVTITYNVNKVKMGSTETTIKSELTDAEYNFKINSESVIRDGTTVELQNACCTNEDITNDDNALLLPELANVPIIKPDPNFEATDTQFISPFYAELYETHANQLYETNNSGNDSSDEELQLHNVAPNNSSPSIGSANENIGKLEMKKKRCDKKPTFLQCPKCNKEFRNKIYLDAHVQGIHFGQENPFQCSNCSIAFKIYKDLNLHILTTHTDQIKEVAPRNRRIVHNLGYNCQICGQSYGSKRVLSEHLKRHNKIKGYVCYECGAAKVTHAELLLHIRTHTPNLDKFPCPRCPKEFNSKNSVYRHVTVVHEGLKSFPCTFCERRFSTSKAQIGHERLHRGERPFKCNLCHKGFALKEGLVYHMKNHDKRHVCSYCSQRFASLRKRKDHEKGHLGNNSQ